MISTTHPVAQFVPASALVLAISAVGAIASSAVADAALVDLGAIAECDVREAVCPDEDHQRFDLFHDQDWRLREKINGIVATTVEGLRVKARAAEIAFPRGMENEGAGAFVGLARSINTNILRLGVGA
jgi:hypothetical protein